MKQISKFIMERANFLVKKHLPGKTTEFKTGDIESTGQLDIDDILVAVYSYNSRHVYFYKVKGTKGKSTVILDEIGHKMVSGAYNAFNGGEVMPEPDKVKTANIEARIGKNGLRIKGQSKYIDSLHFWSGNAEHVYTD